MPMPQSSSPSTASQKEFASCQHSIKENYAKEDASSYFSKKYLKNTPTWPSTCAMEGCSAAFGQNYKVSIKHPVFCCVNAKKKYHPCIHAYCQPCFEAFQGAAGSGNSPRKRRRPNRDVDSTEVWCSYYNKSIVIIDAALHASLHICISPIYSIDTYFSNLILVRSSWPI